ncbi:MAG: aminotransferase class I/II-fold pyridoxal phosphate-dependent enzyme [Alphaproteobacteria bacterium]|nr:aminotransferase class I/II-fold pyridoxal phosphate-dependent enzyme [Alphaproteobacteria bacterium]
MADIFDRFAPLMAQRDSFFTEAGADPFTVRMDQVISQTEAMIGNRRTILCGTNNYLGLTFAPEALKAAHAALDDFGTGTTGSRVANGTYVGHKALEDELKTFFKKDHAIVFSTGFLANLGVLSTLMGPDDFIVMDADCHASIYDGVRMSQAQIIRFKHNDAADLDKRLARLADKPGNKLIVIEGIYSMLGDTAPLKDIVAVKKKHANTYILSDEAHSLGVLGRFGRGLPEQDGVEADVDFIVGTFSKSAGTVGGFCVSSHPKFDTLRLVCRPYIFTASLPPSVVASAAVNLSIIRGPEGGALRKRLRRNAQHLHARLTNLGLKIASGPSPVVAVVAPSPEMAVAFWRGLIEAGVYVNLALPPATPYGYSLLRCSLCAAHTEEQLDEVVAIFGRVAADLGLIERCARKVAGA